MENIYTKIDKAIKQINQPSNKINFNKIYSFTTENIDGYIKKFDLNNKSLLTVGSSSDQVFNAYYCGAKDITLIDINPFIEEFYDLKKTSIEELSYRDFFKFLSTGGYIFNNYKALNYRLFKKIVEKIDNKNSQTFWLELIKNTKPQKLKDNLFSDDTAKIYELQMFNNYLEDEKSYNKLKSRIKNFRPTFIVNNIYKYKLNRNYDNIFLSNIADYNNVFKTRNLYEKLKNNLNKEGKILISYLYETEKDMPYLEEDSKIYDLKDTIHIFKDAKLETIAGVNRLRVNGGYPNDSVLVYKKKK